MDRDPGHRLTGVLRHGRRVFLCGLVAVWSCSASGQNAPAIAAASDLKFALDEIAQTYESNTGRTVRLTFGSSGNFFRQIQQGAPFELFLSADDDFVERLARDGLTVDAGALYAIGRIVLFTPKASTIRADEQMKDLAAALKDGRLKRFAIANPDHAPYGRAAQEALTTAGLWTAIKPRLVLGENVSQAAQFAASGSTQGGIFALSLALSPTFKDAGNYVTLPDHLYRPLRQRMVLLKRATPPARDFYAYLQQPAARAVFRKYGFTLPGE